jgi:hypothetical protein
MSISPQPFNDVILSDEGLEWYGFISDIIRDYRDRNRIRNRFLRNYNSFLDFICDLTPLLPGENHVVNTNILQRFILQRLEVDQEYIDENYPIINYDISTPSTRVPSTRAPSIFYQSDDGDDA